jgi:hypothetical protein
MPATRGDIERWLKTMRDEGYTHMIVKCDDFEYRGNPDDSCCYPVYVKLEEDVAEIEEANNDRTMEVYSANHTDEEQLAEFRARHYD